MSPEIIIEVIKILPSVLWFLFLVILVARLYKPFMEHLLPRISGLKAFGVEATFIRDEIEKAASQAEKEKLSADDKSRVERRLQRDIPLLQKMRILWVDDNPGYIAYESRILQATGAKIDIVTSSEQAVMAVNQNEYDLIISDIAREGISDEGIRFFKSIRQQKPYSSPVIFYAGNINWEKGTPPFAFGITNRLDNLLHYVMDVAERLKI
jgi:CheY-like chemotaxis protein